MTKTCNTKRRIGKEGNGTAASNGRLPRKEKDRRASLERLVRECGGRAYLFAYRLSGDAEEAKEIVQEAFYRLLRSWNRYDTSRPVEGLVFRVLRNVFYDARKRYERRRADSLERPVNGQGHTHRDVLAHGEPDVLETLERSETIETVHQALSGLSPEHRAVLALRDLQGLTYDEIAGALRVPSGTVRSRIFRARQSFRTRARRCEALAY